MCFFEIYGKYILENENLIIYIYLNLLSVFLFLNCYCAEDLWVLYKLGLHRKCEELCMFECEFYMLGSILFIYMVGNYKLIFKTDFRRIVVNR